jgi:hypothetical protein
METRTRKETADTNAIQTPDESEVFSTDEKIEQDQEEDDDDAAVENEMPVSSTKRPRNKKRKAVPKSEKKRKTTMNQMYNVLDSFERRAYSFQQDAVKQAYRLELRANNGRMGQCRRWCYVAKIDPKIRTANNTLAYFGIVPLNLKQRLHSFTREMPASKIAQMKLEMPPRAEDIEKGRFQRISDKFLEFVSSRKHNYNAEFNPSITGKKLNATYDSDEVEEFPIVLDSDNEETCPNGNYNTVTLPFTAVSDDPRFSDPGIRVKKLTRRKMRDTGLWPELLTVLEEFKGQEYDEEVILKRFQESYPEIGHQNENNESLGDFDDHLPPFYPGTDEQEGSNVEQVIVESSDIITAQVFILRIIYKFL